MYTVYTENIMAYSTYYLLRMEERAVVYILRVSHVNELAAIVHGLFSN